MGSIPDTSPYDSLPTLDRLGVTDIPADLDPTKAAQEWLDRFSKAVEAKDTSSILGTIHPDGWWRDIVSLTWDIRTFHGPDKIKKFLDDRLGETQFAVSPVVITATLAKKFPDVQWIILQFPFETATGKGVATTYLVPTPSGKWQSFIICTDLDTIKGTKESFGPGRDPTMGRADVWRQERTKEQAFEDYDPEVLIVGAGQSGLDIAARLKEMGVSSLIVEKHARVGDQWRKRYDSLRLHDFVCEYYALISTMSSKSDSM